MRTTLATRLVITQLALVIALKSPPAWAWGSIGHRMIAETAALLLARNAETGWGDLLARHRFFLGFYSFVPDAVFRPKDGHKGASEAPTHYFDIDMIIPNEKPTSNDSKLIEPIPRDYEEAKSFIEGKIGAEKFAKMGVAPWRIQQFQQLAWDQLKNVAKVAGTYQSGEQSEGDSEKIYYALYYLGIMSHYSGDATMPYHASSDFNGWKVNEGGIHFYFENDCLDELEPGLSDAVFQSAQKHKKEWLNSWHAGKAPSSTVVMYVFLDSLLAVEQVSKIDRAKVIIKPSQNTPQTPALRKPPAIGCKYFRDLLIERLAKGSVLTAFLWNTVTPKDVDFSSARSLQFSDLHLDPTYIEPNYSAPTFKDDVPVIWRK